MKFKLCLLLLLGFCGLLPAQDVPALRDWNMGLATGLGGVHYIGYPSIEANYRAHALRIAPFLPYWGIGLEIGVARLPFKEKNHGHFIASLQYSRNEVDYIAAPLGRDVREMRALAGAKFLFAKRMFTRLQLGAAYTESLPDGTLLSSLNGESGAFQFVFELGIGVNLFKNLKE